MSDTMMDAARTALHLDVACPRCGAGFSEPCRTATGKHAQVHAQRADLSAAGRVKPDPCLCTMLGLPCECRKRGRPQTQPHGTPAAVRRHYRHEGPGWRCRPCMQARAREYADRWRRELEQRQPAPERAAPAAPAAARQIREMRHEAAMTQQELAAALGVSQATLSHWEAGRYRPALEILVRVAQATEVRRAA